MSPVLLIHAPGARICEPFSSVGRLAGELGANGVDVAVWDASLDLTLELLKSEDVPGSIEGQGSGRPRRDPVAHSITLLRQKRGYASFDRYQNAVGKLEERLLQKTGGVHSLADFRDDRYPPLTIHGLERSAREWKNNALAPLFGPVLDDYIEGRGCSTVGFSLSYLSQAGMAFAMAGYIRERHPQVKCVMGGGLVISFTSLPDWSNHWPWLWDGIHGGSAFQWLRVFHELEPAPQTLGSHDYQELLPWRYLSPGPVIPVSASSGCWWKGCTFCPERYEDMPYLQAPPAKTVQVLHELTRRYDPVLFHITDNEVSPALCAALMADPPGVSWYGFSRFFPKLADREFCVELANSGCVMLQLGLESAHQGVLDHLNKGISLSLVVKALENLRHAGIGVYLYLLFGTPVETRESALVTRDFCVAHAHEIDFYNLALFNLPVESPAARELPSRGNYDAELSLYMDFEHPLGWHRGQIRPFLDQEFRGHPALRPAILRNPPVFTSNHAPFFLHMVGKPTPL
ncbi:radical SAM protein [Myxococcota bacterium]|nr:radical SAM protein [Myxococcota bacterium]